MGQFNKLFFLLTLSSITLCAEKSDIASGDCFSPDNYLRRKSQSEVPVSAAKPAPATLKQPIATKQNTAPAPKQKTLATDPASHIQIGGNYTFAKISPQGHPHFTGNLGGMQAIYEYKTGNRIYGGLKFAWRQGLTHGSSETRFLLDFDVQERIGYTFGWPSSGWMMSLFTGFGYRHLGEHLSTSSSSAKFNYNEFYVPLAVFTNYQFNSIFAMGLDLTWMPQVFPTLTITPLKGARWILTNEIGNGLVEMPFIFTLSNKYHMTLILKPFFEFWMDGHTNAKTELGTTLHIPHNDYIFAGTDLNFCWSF